MQRVDAVLGSFVERNNERIERAERIGGTNSNPRALEQVGWHRTLVALWPAIRAEWDAFAGAGGRTPLIEDLLEESQGNTGEWRAGLLFAAGRPTALARRHFPGTLAGLAQIPGLQSALWSVLEPGAELPEHHGPNRGVLRYHLGVSCGSASALRVGSRVVDYVDGQGVLFDDTEPHAAWNRGTTPRVTLFCEIERPLPLLPRLRNRAVQLLIRLDTRYRRAPRRADELHRDLNGAGLDQLSASRTE